MATRPREGAESDAAAKAADELYGVGFKEFTAERKRMAGELKASGEAAAAAAVLRLQRPTLASWTVNQLYRRARRDLDDLLAAGHRMKRGERAAAADRRGALDRLRERAASVLTDGGQAASPATLRRVTTTLEALAAAGFAPDPPGQLVGDRDPPGFDVVIGAGGAAAMPAPARGAHRVDDGARARAALKQKKIAARERASEARARVDVRRGELREAETALVQAQREVDRRRAALATAEKDHAAARAALEALEA